MKFNKFLRHQKWAEKLQVEVLFKRLKHATKVQNFTSLTMYFSSQSNKYLINYPPLKIKFLKPISEFSPEIQRNFMNRKTPKNEENLTHFKTTSNWSKIMESHLFRHSLSIQIPSKIAVKNTHFLKVWIFLTFAIFLKFSLKKAEKYWILNFVF